MLQQCWLTCWLCVIVSVKDKLSENSDSEVLATSLRISLLCPVSVISTLHCSERGCGVDWEVDLADLLVAVFLSDYQDGCEWVNVSSGTGSPGKKR